MVFVFIGGNTENKDMEIQIHVEGGDFSLLKSGGIYEKPMSCFGCGIGWFS